MPFDRILAVDWSAANAPKRGKDSIWIAEARGPEAVTSVNIATRAAAMTMIGQACRDALRTGERMLVGFDFPFGYPVGTARHLASEDGWEALWAMLARMVEDGPDNRSNRFELAARLNQFLPNWPRFWGHPHGRAYSGLTPTKPRDLADGLSERRIVEAMVRSAKPVWQMSYTGSVGSQALLGIARLEALRNDPALKGAVAVWPFETGFAANLDRPIILAEIYPSLYPVPKISGAIKDRQQVEMVASRFAAADRDGSLLALLGEPAGLSPAERSAVLGEEGWIVGVGSMC